MASKLQIYNHALLMMKERRLSGLSEDRESRRTLDEFYDEITQYCLEQGMWKFAMRSQTLSQSSSGLYSFTYRFNKPSDLVHTFAVYEDSGYDPPMVDTFVDEGEYYYANPTSIRVRYSSNSANFGMDLSQWPQTYAQYVAAELAAWASYAITGNEKIAAMLDRKAKVLLTNCLSLYSVTGLPGMRPFNSFARSLDASEANNLRPELQPFGAEVKAMLSGGQGGN